MSKCTNMFLIPVKLTLENADMAPKNPKSQARKK